MVREIIIPQNKILETQLNKERKLQELKRGKQEEKNLYNLIKKKYPNMSQNEIANRIRSIKNHEEEKKKKENNSIFSQYNQIANDVESKIQEIKEKKSKSIEQPKQIDSKNFEFDDINNIGYEKEETPKYEGYTGT